MSDGFFMWGNLLVAEADADGFGGLDEFAIGLDEAEFVDGFFDGDGVDVVGLVADHAAEGSFLGEFDCHDAEAHAEDAIEGGGCAAALEVAEGAGAGVFGGEFLEAGGDLFSDAAEADFAAGVGAEGDEVSIGHAGSFGDDDESAVVAEGVALFDVCGDVFEVEGDFGEEDDVCATGDAAPEGDPSGVAAHHFEDHDAFVAFGSGVEAIEGVDDGGDGAVEAEGHGGGGEVVVDGFGDADDGPAFAVELEAGGE